MGTPTGIWLFTHRNILILQFTNFFMKALLTLWAFPLYLLSALIALTDPESPLSPSVDVSSCFTSVCLPPVSPKEQQLTALKVTLLTALRGPLQSTQLLQGGGHPFPAVPTHSTGATQRDGAHSPPLSVLVQCTFECTLSLWILLKTFDMGQVLRD